MFLHRDWPEGLNFPACEPCNHDTSAEDLLVSVLGRIDPVGNRSDADGRLSKLFDRVKKLYPTLLDRMLPTAREARQMNQLHGLIPAPGRSQRETRVVKIPEEFHRAVKVVARKLAKGIFYKEQGRVFPLNGCLLMHWFSNVELYKSGKYDAFEQLKDLSGHAPRLTRGRHYLNDQFEYKFSSDGELFVLQARFNFSFGAVIFGAENPHTLEDDIIELTQTTNFDSPFSVLQSSLIPTS